MSLFEYFSCTFFHFEYLRSIMNKSFYFFENWKMFSAPYIDFSLTEASYSSAGKASKQQSVNNVDAHYPKTDTDCSHSF